MDVDAIRATIFKAARMRIPRFDERDTVGMRIDRLESYLLAAAEMRGELDEARLYAHQALFDLDKQWDAIPQVAWEVHAPTAQRARTQAAIQQAKRMVEPDLHEAIEEAKWLVARLTEQINRISHMGDDQIASRVYTLMAGS